MTRYTLSPSGLLLLALLSMAASPSTADAQQWRVPRGANSSVDTTYRFQPGGLVDAEQVSGDITITAWDRPEVRVRAWAEKGRVVTELSANRVRLRVEGVRNRRGNQEIGESNVEIMVPAGTRVRAASVSGDVEVRGTRSEVEASTVSGDLDVSDAIGLTSASTVSGDLEVTGIRGDVTVKTVSGDLTLRDVEGDVRASSVSGELSLRGLNSRTVNAKSTSGSLEFAGDIRPDGRYEFTSHSGDVTVILPASASATVSTRTFSGELESDFPITLEGRNRRSTRSMEFSLGGGGARISIETFSGEMEILRDGGRSRR